MLCMPGNDGDGNRNKRYVVQFQKDRQLHSDTDELRKAKLYASSLANWNLAAQIPDFKTRGDGKEKRGWTTQTQ